MPELLLVVMSLVNAASGQPGIVPGSLVELRTHNASLDPSRKITLRTTAGHDFRIVEIRHPFVLIALAPPGLPIGPAAVILQIDDTASEPFPIEVVPENLGIYTTGFYFGPARAANGLTQPAAPGDILTLWGTGLGRAIPDITIAGLPAAIHYAGPAPGFPGLDQINVIIPDSVPHDCYAAVRFHTNGRPANHVSITTGERNKPCLHPLGLTASQMAELDRGGVVPTGNIGIYTLIGPPPEQVRWDVVSQMDHADASFLHTDAAGLAILSRTQPNIAPGQCLGTTGVGSLGGILGAGVNPPIDLGPAIKLSSGTRSAEIVRASSFSSHYTLSLPPAGPTSDPATLPLPFWTAGTWTIEAARGATAGPLRVEVDLPPALRLRGVTPLSEVPRARDFVLEWNPAGFGGGHVVTASLTGSYSFQPDSFSTTTGVRTVTCAAQANSGRIIFPSDDLAPFDRTDPAADRPAMLMVTLGNPLAVVDVPYTPGGPIRTSIRFSSGYFTGILLR